MRGGVHARRDRSVRRLGPPRAGRSVTGGEPLNRDDKARAIAELTERLRASDTMLAADYRGLSVAQLKLLRDRIRAEAEFSVVKNTLARRAALASGREEILQYLEGPTGIFWITGDPALAAKTLTAFAKEVQGLLSLKGGVLSGKALDAAQVDALTRLPPREQLIAQLAGGVAAPLFALGGLAQPLQKLGGGMNELLASLARTLEALRAQKESTTGSPA